jgi:hypothetical protein
MDEGDMLFWSGLQHILESVEKQKRRTKPLHDQTDRAKTFFNFDTDHRHWFSSMGNNIMIA